MKPVDFRFQRGKARTIHHRRSGYPNLSWSLLNLTMQTDIFLFFILYRSSVITALTLFPDPIRLPTQELRSRRNPENSSAIPSFSQQFYDFSIDPPMPDLCKNWAGLYGARSPENAAEKTASRSQARQGPSVADPFRRRRRLQSSRRW